jgi:hypothetical protein
MIITLLSNCKFQQKIYLINHGSARTLTTGRKITSETNSIPANVIDLDFIIYKLSEIDSLDTMYLSKSCFSDQNRYFPQFFFKFDLGILK